MVDERLPYTTDTIEIGTGRYSFTQETQQFLDRAYTSKYPKDTYELLAGVNIGSTHPVIDDVHVFEGIVTSMKTMDTDARLYHNYPHYVFDKGKEYVDDFEDFKGVNTKDGLAMPLDQIHSFHLEIAVRDTVSPEQRLELEKLQDCGSERGVRVVIAEVA